MLDQVKEKNSQIFIEHFNQVFGEKFEVECDWGFPVLSLGFKSKTEEREVHWVLTIDVVKSDYTLQTLAAKISGEGEEKTFTPEYAVVDKTTIDFILERSVMLSNSLFSQTQPENEEKLEDTTKPETEEKVEDITEPDSDPS
jgi:hypothetical protein